MKEIFFKSNKKEEIMNIIENYNLLAIDSHITIESKMCDDYIQIVNDTVILAVPFNHEACVKALFKDFEELNFTPSGNLENPTKRLEYAQNYEKYMIFHFDIKSPKRVYAFESKINEKNLFEIGNPTKQELFANILLYSKRMNNILLEKEISSMQNQVFFNEDSYKKEENIDKIVRYCNRTINARVRSHFDIDKNTEGYFKIGATSPKRNFLHRVALLNNVEILKMYFKNNYFDKNENKEVEKNKYLNILNQNNKEATFLAYNYYEGEVYIKIDNVHYTIAVNSADFYDFIEKGEIGKIKINYDSESINICFKYGNIFIKDINKEGNLTFLSSEAGIVWM